LSRGGRKVQTHCSRGHEYVKHGYVNASGWNTCRRCVRDKSRRHERLKKFARRMEKLLRSGLMIDSTGLAAWQAQAFRFFDEVEGPIKREDLRLREIA
jgi:hypothetical protein